MTGQDYGVMSPQTWRLADLSAKHAFLLNGIGWGSMPLHMIERDLATGALVMLQVEGIPEGGMKLAMSADHPAASPPGPDGEWFIERLKIFLDETA